MSTAIPGAATPVRPINRAPTTITGAAPPVRPINRAPTTITGAATPVRPINRAPTTIPGAATPVRPINPASTTITGGRGWAGTSLPRRQQAGEVPALQAGVEVAAHLPGAVEAQGLLHQLPGALQGHAANGGTHLGQAGGVHGEGPEAHAHQQQAAGRVAGQLAAGRHRHR